SYAVQYARILGSGARVVAFARNLEKLKIATQYGADHIISIKDKTTREVAAELNKATGQSFLDAIIDCAGAPQMMQMGFDLLGIGGHYADVGFVGDRIDIPVFPRGFREQKFHGSFWGKNGDLTQAL